MVRLLFIYFFISLFIYLICIYLFIYLFFCLFFIYVFINVGRCDCGLIFDNRLLNAGSKYAWQKYIAKPEIWEDSNVVVYSFTRWEHVLVICIEEPISGNQYWCLTIPYYMAAVTTGLAREIPPSYSLWYLHPKRTQFTSQRCHWC